MGSLLALTGVFFAGKALPGILTEPEKPLVTHSTPTPAHTQPQPSLPPQSQLPQPPGNYRWDDLRGGECLEPYTSPWQEKFTVVDCTTAHTAQLISRGTFAETGALFPGEAAITAQLNLLCTAATVLDPAATQQYPDLLWQASYPVSSEQWQTGFHDYFCFINRSSAQEMTGSFAVSPPAT